MSRIKRALRSAFAGLVVTAAMTSSVGATAVTANGACLLASCTSSALPATGSTSSSFGGAIAVNGDPFRIGGLVSAGNSAGLIVSLTPQFTITYTGSAPLGRTDVLKLVITQQYTSLAAISVGSFFYEVQGSFGGHAGSGTSLVTDNLINGTSVGVFIANPPGAIFGFEDKPNLNAPLLNPLTDTFDYTLTVAAGTLPGFFVEVAEPGSMALLLGAGLLAIVVARRRVRRVRPFSGRP